MAVSNLRIATAYLKASLQEAAESCEAELVQIVL